jgi:hypothetical protein
MIEINNNSCISACNADEIEYLNSNNIVKVTDNNLLNYAFHYAKLGYPVIPLHNVVLNKDFKRCSCSDWKTCDKPGKHPRTRHGHKDATTNENQILKWWTYYPNANIGILTGIETGIFVLDIDLKHDGENSLEELKDYYRHKLKDKYDCEETLTAYTGSGGRHLLYKHPMDFKINSSESRIDAGLDIKGEESYIVAAPSNHWSEGEYSWHGVNTAITEAPNWLIYEILRLQNESAVDKSNTSEVTSVERIPERERNSYLSAQARGLVNSFSEKDGLRILLKKNKDKLIEPLSEKEVERIVKKTWRRFGKNQNREMGLKK